jgi:hypothetical protein
MYSWTDVIGWRRRAVAAIVVILSAGSSLANDGQRTFDLSGDRATSERDAIESARALVRGGQAYDILIIDPELAADPAAVRRLGAFTVRDANGRMRPKVYMNGESSILQRAARGERFYVKVLAAVLVHEIEHLKGASESVARVAERLFFSDLVAQGLIEESDGLRYLALLRRHSSDVPEAER